MAPISLPWRDGDADGGASIAGELAGRRILAPLLTSTVPAVADQVRVATALARTRDAALYVTNPVAGPDRRPVEHRRRVTGDDDRELLEWATDRADGLEGRFGRRAVKGVLSTVAAHDVDTLVLPGTSSGSVLRRGAAERVAAQADADVVVVNGRPGYGDVASILLPVAGGPHSGLAADVARRVAEDADAWIDVLHVVEGDATERRRERAEEYVEAARRRVARPETTSTWVLEAEDPAEAIANQSSYYGLTVVGAPTKGRLRRFVGGSTNRSVRSGANSVVLSARDNTSTRPLVEQGE